MNINHSKNDQKGFTIVELLIVIVVIGILAAITIVAFNGIQNRGKTASGQALAKQVAQKAEAYNTIQTGYPTYAQLTGTTGPSEARLDNPSAVKEEITGTTPVTINATTAESGKAVYYRSCAAGANITYWDYTKATGQITIVKAGTGC